MSENEGKIFDVTMTIRDGMISWPGDGAVRVVRERSMAKGDRLNQSRLELSAHTGTHIDAPVHFIRDGAGIESIPLERLLGPALVLDLPGLTKIGAAGLKNAGIPEGTGRLLLKTDNGRLLEQAGFDSGYSHLTEDGAAYLVDKGINLVGIDYLSVAAYGKGEAVHRALLTAGVVIIEGLDLRRVPAGAYNLAALPLRIEGCDGSPARVVLTSR